MFSCIVFDFYKILFHSLSYLCICDNLYLSHICPDMRLTVSVERTIQINFFILINSSGERQNNKLN